MNLTNLVGKLVVKGRVKMVFFEASYDTMPSTIGKVLKSMDDALYCSRIDPETFAITKYSKVVYRASMADIVGEIVMVSINYSDENTFCHVMVVGKGTFEKLTSIGNSTDKCFDCTVRERRNAREKNHKKKFNIEINE